ncbi:hypothetical protein RSW49_24445, partial [Escherichia coli]|uniref:hypothetical protein n=1 Tax=Escherichia coli TaxID=562 RepID=UPI0028DF1AE1
EYYEHCRAEREAEKARFIGEAEPVAAALEKRLNQGFPVSRLLVEAGITEPALRYILDRRPPAPDRSIHGTVQGVVTECEWR